MRTQASRITGAAGRWKARLTGPKHPGRKAVAAAVVLVAASALAGRGDAGRPFAGTVTLESGVGASVSDRALQVPAISVGEAKVKNSKGTPKLPPSALAHLDIPGTALLAYQTAVLVMEEVDESCGLDWPLLAAIGRVESNHGR